MTRPFRAVLRHPYWWLVLGLLWTSIIIYFCFVPNPPSLKVTNFDKFEHAVAFAGLAFWFASLYQARKHWQIAGWLALLGLGIEIGQSFTDYREGSVMDFVADCVGIIFGIGLAHTPLGAVLRYIETRVFTTEN